MVGGAKLLQPPGEDVIKSSCNYLNGCGTPKHKSMFQHWIKNYIVTQNFLSTRSREEGESKKSSWKGSFDLAVMGGYYPKDLPQVAGLVWMEVVLRQLKHLERVVLSISPRIDKAPEHGR